MLFREIIAVCSEIHTKHTNTMEITLTVQLMAKHWGLSSQNIPNLAPLRRLWIMCDLLITAFVLIYLKRKLGYLILLVKELLFFEKSVNVYHCTRRHVSEESNLLHHRGDKLGSFISLFVLIRWTYGLGLYQFYFKTAELLGHKPVLLVRYIYITLWLGRMSQPSE
jgi:hypothetical protein